MKSSTTFKLCAVLILTFLATTASAAKQTGSDWNATLEAAKREGMVKCACPPRREFAVAFKKGFEDAYPGITLEITAATLPAFPLRVAKEQSAKMFLWDIYTFGPGAEIFDLKNKGGLESHVGLLELARSTERFSVDRRHQGSLSRCRAETYFWNVLHHIHRIV